MESTVNKYRCPTCGAMLKNFKHLNEHVKLKHSSNESLYHCEKCGKYDTNKKSNFTRHMSTCKGRGKPPSLEDTSEAGPSGGIQQHQQQQSTEKRVKRAPPCGSKIHEEQLRSLSTPTKKTVTEPHSPSLLQGSPAQSTRSQNTRPEVPMSPSIILDSPPYVPQDVSPPRTPSSGPSKRRLPESPTRFSPRRKKCFTTVPKPTGTKFTVRLYKRAMNNHIKIHRITPNEVYGDTGLFFNDAMDTIIYELNMGLCEHQAIKYNLTTLVRFYKSCDEEETTCEQYFASVQQTAFSASDFKKQIDGTLQSLDGMIEQFIKNGSGWVMDRIVSVDVSISKYAPLKGSSYLPLPKWLADKKAIINVRNEDQKCFVWSILASKHEPIYNPQRVNWYKQFEAEIKTTGMTYPVTIDQVPEFEKLNQISVNVYGINDVNSFYPLYITKSRGPETEVIHLLLLETPEGNQHYCWIKDMNRLLFDQTKHNSRAYYCCYCLGGFRSQNILDVHMTRCRNGLQSIEMPEEGTVLSFKNIKNQLRCPVVVYADFECLTEKVDTCNQSGATSFTNIVQNHLPCGVAAYAVEQCCCEAEYREIVEAKVDDDCILSFLEKMAEYGEAYQKRLDVVKPMKLTPEDWRRFNGAKKCHICDGSFEYSAEQELELKRVRDHCHLCGKFRGAAHSKCNLDYINQRDISVFLHNLRRYDGHLIMQKIGEFALEKKYEVECIAKGYENYLSFSLKISRKRPNGKRMTWRLRFKDSYQFLTASLDTLVKGMDRRNFNAMHHYYQDASQRDLLLRKGVYPYDYMDSTSKFSDTRLPPVEAFYNQLTEEHIKPDDYAHAQRVWNAFNMKTLEDYHNLYLKCDVLLLLDVFENCRSVFMENYHLDCAHYITLPSYSWDACLKYTNVKLDLLSDQDMYTFMEAGIRGGVAMIPGRYAHANNPQCEGYDPSKPNTWIIYFDENNLYGWCMNEYLPVKDFKCMSESEITQLNVEGVADNADTGYILEVDLEYPRELHDSHSDYPLAPERLHISEDMLSPYSLKLMKTPRPTVEKLTPNLNTKKKYIIHYRNLKYYLSLGMKLNKIHRVIQFTQEAWMAPYITINTKRRKRASSAFEKDLYKLLNNSVYGKSTENVRKYMDIRLVTSVQKLNKHVAKPFYEDCRIFNENLVAVKLRQSKVLLNKPIYTGFAVLDLSKLLMYQFHYGHIVKRYGPKASLLLTDTDSVIYVIETEDVYKDMKPDLHLFDTSDYPEDHPLFSNQNKKVLGKMKDECNGRIITEFVGLRAKMYSIKLGVEVKKKAKGVQRAVVVRNISHDDYLQALFGGQPQHHLMRYFRTEKHQIFTVVQSKVSLSAGDDKRYILDDGVKTLAHGHYSITYNTRSRRRLFGEESPQTVMEIDVALDETQDLQFDV